MKRGRAAEPTKRRQSKYEGGQLHYGLPFPQIVDELDPSRGARRRQIKSKRPPPRPFKWPEVEALSSTRVEARPLAGTPSNFEPHRPTPPALQVFWPERGQIPSPAQATTPSSSSTSASPTPGASTWSGTRGPRATRSWPARRRGSGGAGRRAARNRTPSICGASTRAEGARVEKRLPTFERRRHENNPRAAQHHRQPNRLA